MIPKSVKLFCKEDPSLIENYELALNDTTQVWDIHHRLEVELNLRRQDLKDRDLYLNRPASELIFLTHGEHTTLHNKTIKHTPERNKRNSEAQKKFFKNHPKRNRGENNPAYSRRFMSNGIDRVFPKPEQFDYYLNLGHHFGMK